MNVTRAVPWGVRILVGLALALGAGACGGGDEGSQGAQTKEAGAKGEQLKVGLVTDTGGVDDRGFNEFSINGLEKAEKELGVKGRVFVSQSGDDYLPNLTSASEEGNDLVISVGFLLTAPLVQVAEQFRDIDYGAVDGFLGTPPDCKKTKTCVQPNAVGLLFPSEESGYLAGVVAALMTKTGTVSTVGGVKIPPVDNWIAGFQQAVADTKPGVKTLNQYSQDFEDPAKCKEIALDQIQQGSDVVFQVAGKCGLGALDAACEKGVLAIGVDADQSSAGDCVITSALKPLELAVFQTIKSAKEGKFKGGRNVVFGIQDFPQAKLLAPFSAAVPKKVRDAVEEARKKLASGAIDPPAEIEKVKKK